MKKTLLPELEDAESRRAIAEVIIELLQRWELHEINQACLLGLPSIVELREGKLLMADKNVMQRVGHLLAIHRALQKKFPNQPLQRDHWVLTPNASLNNDIPLSVMLDKGLDGILLVRELVEL